MSKSTIGALLALTLVGGLAACDDSSVVGPDDGIEGTVLELMVDEDLTEALIIDVEAAIAGVLDVPAPSSGALLAEPNPDAADQARALLEQAREMFREARRAWIGGDSERAAQLAEDARLRLAEAMVLVLGDEAYTHLLERVDQIITWLEERVDQEASELLSRIRDLKTQAEAYYLQYQESQGDETLLHAAVERLLLAVQIAHRERVQHRRLEIVRHARHALFMATMALQLADEQAGERTAEQERVFMHAQHLRDDAALALAADRWRLSLALSEAVVNLSLVVVILDPDLPENKVLALIEVSDNAIAQAEAALGDPPSDEFLAALLDRMELLQTRAIQISDTHPRPAVFILWYVAVSARAITAGATAG